MEKTVTVSYKEFEGLKETIKNLKEDLTKHPVVYMDRFGHITSYNEPFRETIINKAEESVLREEKQRIFNEHEALLEKKVRLKTKELEDKIKALQEESYKFWSERSSLDTYKTLVDKLRQNIKDIEEKVKDYNDQGALHRLGNKLYLPTKK